MTATLSSAAAASTCPTSSAARWFTLNVCELLMVAPACAGENRRAALRCTFARAGRGGRARIHRAQRIAIVDSGADGWPVGRP